MLHFSHSQALDLDFPTLYLSKMKYYANHDLLTTAYSQWPKVFIADLLTYYKTIISLGCLFFFFKEKQNKTTKIKRIRIKTP